MRRNQVVLLVSDVLGIKLFEAGETRYRSTTWGKPFTTRSCPRREAAMRSEVNRKSVFPVPVVPFDQLGRRQHQCTMRRAQGRTAKEIGDELQIAPKTVYRYLDAARSRLGCQTTGELLDLVYRTYAPALLGSGFDGDIQLWPEGTFGYDNEGRIKVPPRSLDWIAADLDKIAMQLGCRDVAELGQLAQRVARDVRLSEIQRREV